MRPTTGTASPWPSSEELGNRPGMATTYHQLGMTAQVRGRLDEAEGWYRKSLAINEELGDRPGMAGTYHQLGMIAQARGRLDEAEDWYRKSLAISEELGDRPGMATTYHQLGMIAQDRGRLDEAEDWYRKSLAIREELGDRPGMASNLPPARHDCPGPAGGWMRPRTGTASPSPSAKNSATAPAWRCTYAQLGLLAEDRGQPALALDVEHPVRDLVRRVPQPADRNRARRPGPAHPPARHARPGASLAAAHRPARASAGPRLHHQPPRRTNPEGVMTDPAAEVARAAAAILAPDLGSEPPRRSRGCTMEVQVGFQGGSSPFRWPSSLVMAPASDSGPASALDGRQAFLHVRGHTARPSAGDQSRRRSL